MISNNRVNFQNKITFNKLAKFWLVCILLFLPFQYRIVEIAVQWNSVLKFILYVDEITIVIFILLAIKEIYKNWEIADKSYLYLILPIILFIIVGLSSGVFNQNSLFVTILACFDYIKYFLVIFIYAAFFKEFDAFKQIFRLLLIIGACLGGVAIIQEIWAMTSQYILREEVQGNQMLLLINSVLGDYSHYTPRLGVFRVHSFMNNSIMLGHYLLLILTIYLSVTRRLSWAVFLLLYAGIVMSVSRTVYAGFVFLMIVQIIWYRRRMLIAAVTPMLIVLLLLFSLQDINISNSYDLPWQTGLEINSIDWEKDFNDESKEDTYIKESQMSFRKYTRQKGVEIWKDHPLLGVGPGYFGSIISLKTYSPIYKEYNLASVMTNIRKWSGLDQFWPQVLAETGMIGIMSFVGLFISLFITGLILRHNSVSYEINGLFSAMLTYIIIIIIYTMGSGLNITPILFTFFALVGMGFGCEE